MAWPNTPLTTYVPNSTPAIKAADLNAFQSAINGISAGSTSIAGAVLDGVGGVGPVVRAATSALLRAQAGDGAARSLVDYLGFRTGPVLEIYDNFLGWNNGGGPGGWAVNKTANTAVDRNGTIQGTNLIGLWPTGALRLELNASRTNTDTIGIYTPFLYNGSDSGVTSYLINQCVHVFEWAFCFHGVLTSTDSYMGLISSVAPGNPITAAAVMRAALRYAPGAKSDTHLVLVTNSSSGADSVVDTGITPTANTIYKCRLEVHRSGTPFGAIVRLFVGTLGGTSTLVSSTTNLPIVNSLGADAAWEAWTQSTASVASRSGLELGYWKGLMMPLGSLAAGALTSDV
jgi:hypothetical protein